MNIRLLFLASSLFTLFLSSARAQHGIAPVDPVIERKVDSLLALMTVEEKAGQLNQLVGPRRGDAQLPPDTARLVEQGLVGSFLNVVGAEKTAEIQRIAVERSRLHIPLLFGLDVIHGFRTVFPIPLAEASSWDPQMVERDCRVAAVEAAASGINWTFAPMVDIARDPRWGRIAEGAGEDPYLGSVMSAARVRGFQGKNFSDSSAILACAKHFAAYGGAEGGRDYNTVDISERTLRDVYLPPFRAAVSAGVATLMSSFNEIGGVPSTANHELLTSILRDEWGFRGFVVSDWNSVGELLNHGVAGTPAQAALKGLSAGVDMDMFSGDYLGGIPDLVKSGQLPMRTLDEAVRRVLRVKFALGLFDHPYRNCAPGLAAKVILSEEHRRQARIAATRSFVLLKNDRALLPLGPANKIALIGALAESKRDPLGPWAGRGRGEDVVSLLEGMKKRLPRESALTYAKGYDLTFTDSSGFQDAIKAAEGSDVVVLVAGERLDMSGEAASRSNIHLPGVQEALARRLAATGKPVVLVLMNGRPLCIPWEAENLQAILEIWFPGVEAGNALADALFGDVNPGGKLTASFPRSEGQIPVYYNHKSTGRPFQANERFTSKYLDIPNAPLFPFGYGLSYSTFSYDRLRITTPKVAIGGPVRLSVEVTNTGARRGDEVVQVYVHQEVSEVTRPVKELKAFQRIDLAPGERRVVEFDLDSNALGCTGLRSRYRVEPGVYRVFAGGNSEGGLEGRFELIP